MSRRAAAAASAAAEIRSALSARQRRDDFHAAVPVVGAAALTAATAAVATLPAFATTRRGVAEGLDSDVSDVMPGGDAFQSALLRGTGLLLGGAAGSSVAFQLAQAATGYGAAHGYARAPLAVVGGIASAFAGSELAEPAATFGVRVGRTVRLGAEGLVEDLERIWTASSSSSSSSSTPSARESPRERPETSTAASPRTEREAAAAVDPTSKEALARELSRVRRVERRLAAERKSTTSPERARALDAKLADARLAKADLKATCAATHAGAKLGRVVGEDIAARAAALTEAREAQLSLRWRAERAAAAGDRRERRRLTREAKKLDAVKRGLKADAREAHGVKLSEHAPSVQKR